MDYKERYEQALKRAKELLEDMNKGDYFASNGDIENIFHELKEKETEDERIRKELTEFLKSASGGFLNSAIQCETFGEWLAWLEKQSEKKPAEDAKALDADKVIEWLKITINERAENYGVYNETRLILSYNSIEDLINDFKEDFGL